jgi:hypothetical protein
MSYLKEHGPGTTEIERLHSQGETIAAVAAALGKLQIGRSKVIVSFTHEVLDVIDSLLATFKFLLVTCENQAVKVVHELVHHTDSDQPSRVAIICIRTD